MTAAKCPDCGAVTTPERGPGSPLIFRHLPGCTFDYPRCPRCKVRPQYKMTNGKWRGACHECWRSRLRVPHDEGERRVNARGHWEIVVGGRWVREDRHLASLAGVPVTADTQVRRRGDRLEVAVWQAVDPVTVKGGPAAGTVRPRPGGDRKRGRRTEVTWDDQYGDLLDKLAAAWGIDNEADIVRHAVMVAYVRLAYGY